MMTRHERTLCFLFFFFFNDPATTEISPLPLPAPLPIYWAGLWRRVQPPYPSLADVGYLAMYPCLGMAVRDLVQLRSEEHTSELQSPCNLVCRLLLEKKKINRQQ